MNDKIRALTDFGGAHSFTAIQTVSRIYRGRSNRFRAAVIFNCVAASDSTCKIDGVGEDPD